MIDLIDQTDQIEVAGYPAPKAGIYWATQAQTNELVAGLAEQVGALAAEVTRLANECQRAVDQLAATGKVGVRKVKRGD